MSQTRFRRCLIDWEGGASADAGPTFHSNLGLHLPNNPHFLVGAESLACATQHKRNSRPPGFQLPLTLFLNHRFAQPVTPIIKSHNPLHPSSDRLPPLHSSSNTTSNMASADRKAASPQEDTSTPKFDTHGHCFWTCPCRRPEFIDLKVRSFRSILEPTSPFYDTKDKKNIEFLIEYYQNNGEPPTLEQPMWVHDGKRVSLEESEKLRIKGEAVWEEIVRIL